MSQAGWWWRNPPQPADASAVISGEVTMTMKNKNLGERLVKSTVDNPSRVREDLQRLGESCIGVEDMAKLAKGKLKKPRPIRDWEKNQ
jgi:hypothetical protein